MYLPVERLHSRAESLLAEFREGGRTSGIDEAVVLDREAGHPMRAVSLTCLAIRLNDSYGQLEATGDFEEAIVLEREALDLRPQGHPDLSMAFNYLAYHLSSRHKQLGAMQDLDEAIVLDREAFDLRPKGHPGRSMALSTLVFNFSSRYKQLGEMQDLDEAIVLAREALGLRSQGHPDRPASLHHLSYSLSSRYIQLGAMQDLDEAIVLNRDTLDLRPQGHPDRSISLYNLASNLTSRYRQLGAMQDLDEAIVLAREALGLRPQGHPDRSISLCNLASNLSSRYKQLGAMQDLDEAIVVGREALHLCPQGHPDRSISLRNLAICLCHRFDQVGLMQDLEEAVDLGQEALGLCPQGHPDQSKNLNNRAAVLSSRFRQVCPIQDLDEAIVLGREALNLRPQGHPDRSMSLNSLAYFLSSRYKQFGAMQDLDEAIVLAREALGFCPQGHPERSRSLNDLARCLCNRFTRLKQLQDKEELFGLYAQLVHVPQVAACIDLSAAKAWICAAEDFQHPTILLAYETSLQLLIQHITTLPSLPQHLVILKNHTSSLAVNAFSACLHKCVPARAVELLEQGRGVFWSQLTRLRSPLVDLIRFGPAGKTLADEFTQLALLIRNAFNSPGTDQHERVCHLNLEMERVVINIRKLPGLSRFLLPLLFSDLQRAASGGPVIIVNASKYSCDALIAFPDRDPVHIPLQITQEDVRRLSKELHALTVRAKRADMTRELASFLRKLWDEIVSPIVDCLRKTHPFQSRIWWCPTAEFSVLPLHAAGPYRKGEQNLPDLYISSYTPTLTALIRARRRNPSNSANEEKRFVAIGQAKAAGESELLSVGAELVNIGQRVHGLATFTRIDGEESCTSRVVEELGKNGWVHLACHGLPDRKHPFESAFALHDGHFTIQQIIGCDPKNPEFAYLSACHTTVGDEESPDKVIYLASAMQFIGFRSVIGTMWAVDDGQTNKITSTFYKHMVDASGRLDYTRAALALNKTMKSVHNVPFDQRILYIHLGA
jgi:CHAT domain-containing protein/tetratricopeptide (TPR) repeat protein